MDIASLVGGGVAPALTAVVTAANGGSGAKGAKGAGAASGTASVPWAGTLFERLLGGDPASAHRRAEELGALLTRFVRGGLNAASSTSSSTQASSSSAKSGSLAFLKDAKLSVEEKLARLMVYLSDKYEKQLEEKLKQYSNLENGKAPSGTSTKKSSSSSSSSLTAGLSSLLSKAGLSGLLQGPGLQKILGQVAGPVLAGAATALGMPSLAPAILKAGPLLGSVASGALSALTGGGGSTAASSSSKSSSSSGSSSSTSGAPSEKQLMTEIQILQEKQKEMFTLVSNILRSQHETKMAVLSNVR